MARLTAHDLMAAAAADIMAKVRESRTRRFATLDRPPLAPRRKAGETQAQFIKRGLQEGEKHRLDMWRLLFERFRIDPRSPDAFRRLAIGLAGTYIRALGESGPRAGRPAIGLTAKQQQAFARGKQKGKSLRATALRLAKGDEKEANKLVARWQRMTK